MTTATETAAPAELESEVCSRCHGAGSYSYCQRYGTRCFRCAGHKRTLTKRGAAAAKFLESIRSKPVGEIKVGDVIRNDGITMGGELYTAWFKVESIEPTTDENCGSWQVIDGNRVPTPPGLLNLNLVDGKGGKMSCRQVPPNRMFRVALKAAEKAETMARAIAYQATLTKAGTPRKK